MRVYVSGHLDAHRQGRSTAVGEMRLRRTLHARSSSGLAPVAFTCCSIILLATTVQAMTCFRCTVLPAQYVGEADQPCSKFDGSSKFYHDCPTSTFCMKRIIHYRLSNGTMVTTAERNCASQKYVYQDFNYNERKWQAKESVDTEIYSEGCFKGENRGTPNGPSEYCYCSANYCNASPSLTTPLGIVGFFITAVLIVRAKQLSI